jgi:transposase
MATFTGPERASCVFWFEETKSATQVQRKFRAQYSKEPPSRPTIYSWHKNFVETGCSVLHAKSPGRPSVSDAKVEQILESFDRSPRKSTRHVSRETGIPNATVWRVLRKRLQLEAQSSL